MRLVIYFTQETNMKVMFEMVQHIQEAYPEVDSITTKVSEPPRAWNPDRLKAEHDSEAEKAFKEYQDARGIKPSEGGL